MSRTLRVEVVLVALVALVIACAPEGEEIVTNPDSEVSDAPAFEVDPT